ncbi:hypothetical protein KC19_3G248100 [Ceratodon purpureus]|uniref:Heterokaryon incompatibility domain-containing protein n=1 Tax=Ceratodon purpureus TaxID=3225 RepID=A0A8T0IQ99_CERPU|nr:hypothetical protein KC19_3G248100 [Ceratodon purpureus]
MAEHSSLGHYMCTKCRDIDFRGAFFVKRRQPVDIYELCLDRSFCDIAHILNTHRDCRCCSLILSGIQHFYPALLEEKKTKVTWQRQGTRATVKAQNGEVEFRSVVQIFLGMDIDRVNFAINLLSPSKEDVGFNALRARRVSQRQAELPLIADWISTCKHMHNDCQHKLWQRAISIDQLRLRVIDVQARCIVAASKDCEYIALSYVWGKASMPMTLKGNLETFSLPQGLDLKPLPQTISDAMELVRAVGQRYLWVDALCIIQDDEEDTLHQIGNMNLVYGLALFTIIAADGEGADAGLVGVKSDSRNIVQGIEEVELGLHLTVSLGGFGPHRRSLSKWNTRAWTFQEALLSPRMVIFSGGEMTWECREAVWTEDLQVSPGAIGSFTTPHFSNSMTPLLEGRLAAMNAHSSMEVSPFTAMPLHNLTVYENAVRDYTAREMTYPSDGLNAFAGLAKTFETALATGFVQGLPQNRLDMALIWTPEQALKRRSGFASWSWVGWIGKSRYISMNPNVIKPMVHYYVTENKTGGNHAFSRLPQEWEEENYKPSMRPWRVVKSSSPTATLPIPQPGNLASSYSLSFYALTASSEHFRLEMLKPPLPLFLTLYDHTNHSVGSMGLDAGVYPAVGKYSLIVLSECSHRVQQAGLGSSLPTMITLSTQSGESDKAELSLFNVMLVGWAGGVCERVGLGWMYKANFWKAKPEWTWVVLQ